jgi:hypothetical protein
MRGLHKESDELNEKRCAVISFPPLNHSNVDLEPQNMPLLNIKKKSKSWYESSYCEAVHRDNRIMFHIRILRLPQAALTTNAGVRAAPHPRWHVTGLVCFGFSKCSSLMVL